VALLRRASELYDSEQHRQQDIAYSAGLITRYARKIEGRPAGGRVAVVVNGERSEFYQEPLADSTFKAWVI
jgi:hypothetical protein